jgi:hypothetical protein
VLFRSPFVGRVRPAEATGSYEVETWQYGQRLAVSTVELTGHDTQLARPELVELAQGPSPSPASDQHYPGCFACGGEPTHPLALRVPPAFVAPDRLSVPWIPDARLAVGSGVADLVVAAALDCPTVWATIGTAREAGYPAALLGSLTLRMGGDVAPNGPVRVTARLDAVEGRKLRARSAVVDTDGRVLAALDALYIAVRSLPDADVAG